MRARPQPAADALILLTVGDIPRRDRHELQCILDSFHANQARQDECREILRNEAEFLVPEHTKEQGCGFVAKTDIPAGNASRSMPAGLVSSMAAPARTTCAWATLDSAIP